MITWACKHEAMTEGCPYCEKVAKALAAIPRPSDATKLDPPCVYRLDRMEDVSCHCQSGTRTISSYGCSVKIRCTVSGRFIAKDKAVQACHLCTSRATTLPVVDPVKVQPVRNYTWSYGVTTVPQRKATLLPGTLTSLRLAGFPDPILFVDGGRPHDWVDCKYRVTLRDTNVMAYGNWWLALQELYVRAPQADFYAIFQDDVDCVKNLRHYLERTPWPGPGYLNLYTFPDNQNLKRAAPGFFTSNQQGLGALALVFNQESMRVMLRAEHMIEKFVPKPKKEHRAIKAIDGGVVSAIKDAGMKEWVHLPSLVQHTGQLASTLGNGNPLAPSFPGKDFDALELIQ